jgi:hypothetical protein
MTVGVTKAVELGARHVICASTGNTSASLAAYAARAGIKCTVLIPSGKIAYGKSLKPDSRPKSFKSKVTLTNLKSLKIVKNQKSIS